MTEKRQRQPDEMFCPTCGEPIKKEAVICVHCGVQVQDVAPVLSRRAAPARPHALGETAPKSKMTSVLLAVFLGPWTWLYTFRRNGWKFWCSLVPYLTVGVLWVAIMFGLGPRCFECGGTFTHAFTRWIPTALPFLNIPLWLWSVIDVSVKPSEYYGGYPNA